MTARAILPALIVVVGLAMVVRALSEGGGPLAVGVVVGLLFAVAGAARLYAETRR